MPRFLIGTLALLAGAPALLEAQTGAPAYDIVIRNGRVLDGMGNPWIRADVAIRNGRIVLVGTVPGRGAREIDVSGQYVSPGWIDMMDQSGSVLPRSGLAENKLREGVTTALGGEGGTPVSAGQVAEYFSGLERNGISINFGSYFSATQAREAVLGMASRAPTPEELERMRAIVDTALRGGALGLTTALIYPPSSYHTTDELIELAKVASKYGAVYASHIRGEGKELLTSVAEAIRIGEEGGTPVEIFHLKSAWQPGWGKLMPQVGELVGTARARGVDVAADLYVYTAGGTGLEATIPSWAFSGGYDSLRLRLNDPATRTRLKREVETGSPGWWNIVEASGGWQNVVVVNAQNPANAKYQGKSIAVIAKEMGKDPRDAAWDLVLQGTGRVMAIYHMMSEPDIRIALQFPWTSIGSDAGAALEAGKTDVLGLPHPRSYGNFPRVIAKYVRDEHVLTLEEAIRKMTSWPATRMRLAGRGAIKEGYWADITVFDYEKIQDRATYEQPTLFPDGIPYVIVNGQVVIDQGRHTGARPGKVIYGPGRRATGPAVDRAVLLARVDSVAQAEMKSNHVPGLSVAVRRGGEVILARGYGLADVEMSVPAGAETIYRIGSLSKQFTAAAIMQLVEQGKIGLQDEITKYLPDFPTQGHTVTVHHLLTHTSGIKNYTALGPKVWAEAFPLDLTDAQMVDLFKKEPFDFAPGEKWSYSNSGYYLLGMIIQKVSGMPYGEYMQQALFGPLGLRSTRYCDNRTILPNRAQGYEVENGRVVNDAQISMNTPGAAGALCSSVLDLLAWQQAFNAGRVVSPASRQLMTTAAKLNDGSATHYGFGLGVGDLDGHRMISHSGGINGFITHIGYLPDDDLTVTVLGNTGSAPSGRIAGNIARLTLGLPLPVPKDLPLSGELRARYVGNYQLDIGPVKVTEKNGGLEVQLLTQPPARLLFQGDDTFVLERDAEMQISFAPAGARAEEIRVRAGGTILKGKRTP